MTDKQDPFAKLAEEMMTAPIRAQLKAAKTREERRQAQQASDKDVLHRTWKQWHSKRAQTLQTGPYGNDVAEVISFLESMPVDEVVDLLMREVFERIPAARKWNRNAEITNIRKCCSDWLVKHDDVLDMTAMKRTAGMG